MNDNPDNTQKALDPPMPYNELGLKYNVSPQCIRIYEKEGINIMDEAAMIERLAKFNPKDKASTELKKVKLQKEIEKLNEVVLFTKQKRLQQEQQLVSIDEIKEAMHRISATVTAKLQSLENTLPPLLEGLEANAMIPIIRRFIDETLTSIAISEYYDVNEIEDNTIEEIIDDTED